MAAADATGITLYQANLRTYQLLRYGVPVQVAAGRAARDVHLIDWATPGNNQFALAEEVTLRVAMTGPCAPALTSCSSSTAWLWW